MNIFSKRLAGLIEKSGLRQKELAEKTGISQGALSNYLNGRTPKSNQLAVLVKFFNVTEGYLLGYEEEPASNGTEQTKTKVPKHGEGPYYGMSDGRIPIVSWASAGLGSEYYDMGDDPESTRWTRTDCKDENCYALEVDGDSMSPFYLHGDILVVQPNFEPHNGDLAIVRTNEGKAFFKKLKYSADGKILSLISLNPEYEIMEVPKDQIIRLHRVYSSTRYPHIKKI